MMQHGKHLLGNGHFDGMTVGEVDSSSGRFYAFRYHFHGVNDLVEVSSFR